MRDTSLCPCGRWRARTPSAEFDMIAFTIGYEMAYSNILNMLNLAGVPLRSEDRPGAETARVRRGRLRLQPGAAGGFYRLLLPGRGRGHHRGNACSSTRPAKGRGLDQGCRSWHEVAKIRRRLRSRAFTPDTYNLDGTLDRHHAAGAGAPIDCDQAHRARTWTAPISPAKTIVPSTEIVHDRANLEVFRGCIRGCRFCQAGFCYRPVRHRKARDGALPSGNGDAACASGNHEITLSSLSTSDYRGLKELTDKLIRWTTARNTEDQSLRALPAGGQLLPGL